MSDDSTLTAFYRIFQGNSSFYIHHQAPFTKEGNKMKASWCGFAKYGSKSFPDIPSSCSEGDYVPLTKEQYREHLNGGNGLSVVPLCNTPDKKNVCYFAVIDIDVYGVNFTWLVKRLYSVGFKFAAFLSKSGGLHLYFLFSKAEPAKEVIETLTKIVQLFGLNKLYVNEKNKSKVEIFPKQAVFVQGDKQANGIFLPFYNAANKNGNKCVNKMLNTEGKLVGIEKAIPLIGDMFTSLKEMEEVLKSLPYGDAPYCIQMILLTGALAENDGRNNFLFSAGIYLKKKYKENFFDRFEDMNKCLEVPLEDRDVVTIYNSVTDQTKNYDSYFCKKSPCSDYCDKGLCKQREFGLGRTRNNYSTGADCWGQLTRYDAGDGKEPYYTWEVRVEEGGEFKTIQIDSHKDLLNQVVMQQNCLRDLNWIPNRVKDDVWVATVLKGLIGIEERTIKIKKETDTTEMSLLHEAFVKFLAHKQVQNSAPYMIKVGQVYHADGVYYFTTTGLMKFLSLEKQTLGRVNLRTELMRYGCTEGEVTYKNSKGEEVKIACWEKTDDEELLGMDSFYEDVYEGYEDILQKITVNKDVKEDTNDEERF